MSKKNVFIKSSFCISYQFIFLFLSLFLTYLTANAAPSTITKKNDSNYNNSFLNFKTNVDTMLGQSPALTPNSTNVIPTDLFNISGSLQLGTVWSDLYGVGMIAKYTQLFTVKDAFAFEGDLGMKENRVNMTLGHAFSTKTRIKLTAERLSQNQNFEFDSGAEDAWVSQYASGFEFQHLFGTGFFNNIGMNIYYAKALSEDLDSLIYEKNGSSWINYRRIAGAKSMGSSASLGLKPWSTGVLTLTAYYDAINYDGVYQDLSSENGSQFGYGASLEQYLSKHFKGNVGYSHRIIYDTINVGFEWVHTIFHNKHSIGLSVGDTKTMSKNDYNDNEFTIGLQYYFDPLKKNLDWPSVTTQSFSSWVADPAVRMEKVLVLTDQMSEKLPDKKINWDDANIHTTTITPTTATLIWNAAIPSKAGETVTYDLTVNGKNYKTTDKTYTINNLGIDALYKVKIVASDPYDTDGNNVTQTYSFTTAKGNIDWGTDGNNPITVKLDYSGDGLDYFQTKWEDAKLDPAPTDSDAVAYNYDFEAIYKDGTRKPIKKQDNTHTTDLGNVPVSMTNDNHAALQSVEVTVTTFDTDTPPHYESITKIKTDNKV